MKEEREATILSTPSNKEVRRTMKTREEVAHMLRLRRQGLTPYRIAAVLGCSRATVVRYLRQEGWRPMAVRRHRNSPENDIKIPQCLDCVEGRAMSWESD